MNIDRSYYLGLARAGLRMPLGTDLVLHEHSDAEAITLNADRLGAVIAESAARYHTVLAMPQMNLMLEKSALLDLLGIAETDGNFHFTTPLEDGALARFEAGLPGPFNAALQAHISSVKYIVNHCPRLVPMGLAIGPFSLLTKLLADPITPVYLAGSGATVAEEPEVALLEQLLEISTRLVLRVIELQIDAGAKLMVIAEPAANKVYFSPRQMASGSDVFQRMVAGPNGRIKALLQQAGVELFFHCCGELVEPILRAFAALDPAILSLGSSRVLWQDAGLIGKTTVLYGNLPSKQFYSDSLVSVGDVHRRCRELIGRMKDVGHPFILGTECDVLSVSGCECSIKAKVDAMLAED